VLEQLDGLRLAADNSFSHAPSLMLRRLPALHIRYDT